MTEKKGGKNMTEKKEKWEDIKSALEQYGLIIHEETDEKLVFSCTTLHPSLTPKYISGNYEFIIDLEEDKVTLSQLKERKIFFKTKDVLVFMKEG